MTPLRATVIVVALSLAAAGALGLISRAPAELRRAEPPPDATDPSHGASFTDQQIARHGAYRKSGYAAFALASLVEIAFLIVLARGPMSELVAQSERLPGGFLVRAAVVGAAVALLSLVVVLPLGFVRGFVIERAWGLSTQDLGGWLSDQLRGAGVAAVTAAIASAAFFGIVRSQPRTWWLWGWIAFSALSALLAFLWPIVIAPLFNDFTPLEDRSLARRVTSLAAQAGIDVEEVLVADASKRTTAENAYVAGLGTSKRVVVYDTLLRAGGEDETAFVVAHELAHRSERHVAKGVALSALLLGVGFVVLLWLSRQGAVWAWAGASGIGDLRAVPVLLLFVTGASLLALPVENAVSRAWEASADRIALELTDDPETAVRAFRRLAFANLADLRPPKAAVLALYSHPPIPERIRAALSGPRADGSMAPSGRRAINW